CPARLALDAHDGPGAANVVFALDPASSGAGACRGQRYPRRGCESSGDRDQAPSRLRFTGRVRTPYEERSMAPDNSRLIVDT
ncbi:MAG: hypothetical protein KC432_02615, partial [Thermomicrobiales bacterium]|nr:hypothetical protein [Thermomicrobiales bacterium]